MGAQISLELKHTLATKGGAPALAIADEVGQSLNTRGGSVLCAPPLLPVLG